MPVMDRRYVDEEYPIRFASYAFKEGAVKPKFTIRLDLTGEDYAPIYASLGWLVSHNGLFTSEQDFDKFDCDVNGRPVRTPLMTLISRYAHYFENDSDIYHILRFVATTKRALIDNAPLSKCPRCERYVWASNDTDFMQSKTDWYNKAVAAYYQYSRPVFCLHCGQRFARTFKYGKNELLYKTDKTTRHITDPRVKK